MMSTRPVVAEIDLEAMRSNYGLLRRKAGSAQMFAVVKANAYGHGLANAAQALNDIADGYAVVDFDTALALRKSGFRKPILMLNGMFDLQDGEAAIDAKLWLVLHERWQCEWCLSSSKAHCLKFFFKIDTGMHRLGFSLEEAREWIPKLRARLGEGSLVLMTHMACGDERGGADEQFQLMKTIVEEHGLPASVSNSATLLFQDVPISEQWVRCGIALYGLSPAHNLTDANTLGLKPAMTLKSRLIAIRTLRKGDWIGYGKGYRAPHDLPVGHVACGYGDGYPRNAGEEGAPALIRSVRTRLVGRVSMDLLAIDLSSVQEAEIGDEVVLFGKGLPAEQVADACGTIGYEVFTSISQSVPRHVVDSS